MTTKGLTMGYFDPDALTDVQHPFEPSEYKTRLNNIRERMAQKKIDLLYVTTPEAVCYIHGYYASWYKANSPMRYPQFYGTAIHVDSDRFIYFESPTEIPQLARTSISTDNRYFLSREGQPNFDFILKSNRGHSCRTCMTFILQYES